MAGSLCNIQANTLKSLIVGVGTIFTVASAAWAVISALGFIVLRVTAWMGGDQTMWSFERLSLFTVVHVSIPSAFVTGLMFIFTTIMAIGVIGFYGTFIAAIGESVLDRFGKSDNAI